MTPLHLAGQPSTRRLFLRYAAATLAPVLVLGALLSVLIGRQTNQTGLREGQSAADIITDSSIAPLLSGHDVDHRLTPSETKELARTAHALISDHRALRLRLRDLDGRVIWANDGTGLGTVDPDALSAAAGRDVVHITYLNADAEGEPGSDAGDTNVGPQSVEAYVPVRSLSTGQPVAVVELYLPYAPIGQAIGHSRRVLLLWLGLGLFGLWAALLAVSLSMTRRLRRQASTNAWLAQHDALTALVNRTQFGTLAAAAVANATTDRQTAVGVIDLDRFKDINDTLGHGNGDAVLIKLAERLSASIREGDVVARLGGDEFGVVLSGVHGPSEAVEILSRLRAALSEPLLLGALPLAVEASVGFALAPSDSSDIDLLLARADLAMYVAKREHRGVVHYHPSQDHYDASNLTLVAELADAIATDQLVLHYQPKADLRASQVTAVEALVRWQHPERGLLYPDAFLPMAEQTELVDGLTRWVLNRALRDLPDLDPTGQIAVAVNISARSLMRSDFAEDVLTILRAAGVSANRVILEITETSLLADPERAARTLTTLSRQGIRISIDDFGAGQTSLGYLARLPVSELKIDKAFVLAMTSDPRNSAIVHSVIELGHSLGFTVTAEGVETLEALERLADASCDLVQGYLLARPMGLEALRDVLPRVGGIVAESTGTVGGVSHS